MSIFIRVANRSGGRKYFYLEERWRENGKVRSRSRSLGPVGGKKRRSVTVSALLMGGLTFGLKAAKGDISMPRYREPRAKKDDGYLNRHKHAANDKLKALYEPLKVDISSPKIFAETLNRLPNELRAETVAKHTAIMKEYETTKASLTAKAAPTAAPQAAPAAPEAPAPSEAPDGPSEAEGDAEGDDSGE